MLTPTEDSFRALARSAPWRWTSVHLRSRGVAGDVEAWLARPDGVRVVDGAGRPMLLNDPEQRTDGRPSTAWTAPPARLRDDGLVESRDGTQPWETQRLSDEIFWTNYLWVAMLDPYELSHGTVLADVRPDVVAGRPVWWARVRPDERYDPLCSCCPLLWSYESDTLEHGESRQGAAPARDGERYPSAYDVALDIATGIVVRCLPADGEREALENDILESA